MLYRIEKNGIGPYNYHYVYKDEGFSIKKWTEEGHQFRTMPVPASDGVLCKICPFLEKVSDKYTFDLVFCFLEEKDIHRYFTSAELKKLDEFGFKIISICDDKFFKVLYGETQAVGFKTEDSYNYYVEVLSNSVNEGYLPYN